VSKVPRAKRGVNLNPISLKTEMYDIEGTLLVKNNQFEDLILEVDYETI